MMKVKKRKKKRRGNLSSLLAIQRFVENRVSYWTWTIWTSVSRLGQTWLQSAHPQMRHQHPTSFSKSGNFSEKKVRKSLESEVGKDCFETVSPDHGAVAGLTNPRRLWLPAQEEASQHSSTAGRVLQTQPPVEELLPIKSCQERGCQLF